MQTASIAVYINVLHQLFDVIHPSGYIAIRGHPYHRRHTLQNALVQRITKETRASHRSILGRLNDRQRTFGMSIFPQCYWCIVHPQGIMIPVERLVGVRVRRAGLLVCDLHIELAHEGSIS